MNCMCGRTSLSGWASRSSSWGSFLSTITWSQHMIIATFAIFFSFCIAGFVAVHVGWQHAAMLSLPVAVSRFGWAWMSMPPSAWKRTRSSARRQPDWPRRGGRLTRHGSGTTTYPGRLERTARRRSTLRRDVRSNVCQRCQRLPDPTPGRRSSTTTAATYRNVFGTGLSMTFLFTPEARARDCRCNFRPWSDRRFFLQHAASHAARRRTRASATGSCTRTAE